MTKLYCYDQKPVTENVELDSDSDEVVVSPKAKKRKVTITYNSDDSD